MDDLLAEFLTESSESIAVLDVELVHLEQNPNNPQLLGNIFRIMHTIKGTCGFLGLPRLESLAHAAENILSKIRDNAIPVSSEGITLILKALDRIKNLLYTLEQTQQEEPGDDNDLISQLNLLAEGGSGNASANLGANNAAPTHSLAAAPPELANPAPANTYEAPLIAINPLEPESPQAAPPAQTTMQSETHNSSSNHTVADPVDSASGMVIEEPIPDAKEPDAAKEENIKESNTSNQSIRVNVELLESLMNTVSELVLTRNQLLQILRDQKDNAFSVPLQRLNLVTSELQEGVMKTRMQPIGNAWGKLPRLIRDLANELDKKIELKMLGAETELDRQILELIKDPLTHMVRNSADHGLETPEERKLAGKSPVGTIILNAYHEGGHIIVQITDDGKGLPMAQIRKKIIENKLATEAEVAKMSDAQVQQYIFLPGFSTAKKVTNVSGRGVGMDVVRTNIDKIGGSIDIKSLEGRGTRVIIKIPLTLAIVAAIIVEANNQRFAIPQISIMELVRIAADSEHIIENLNNVPILRLRNHLLPLIVLSEVLQLDPHYNSTKALNAISAYKQQHRHNKSNTELGETVAKAHTTANVTTPDDNTFNSVPALNLASSTQPAAQSDPNQDHQDLPTREFYVVVTQVGENTFGLVVDEIFDTQEIVVKPVSPILRESSLFSGNTILGDGSVVMILDPNGISELSGERPAGDISTDTTATNKEKIFNSNMSLLVFQASDATPKAVPLSLISRLEEFKGNLIEYSNGQPVIQYRNELMPLIALNPNHQINRNGTQVVLVFSDNGYTAGIMIDQIVDITEQNLDIHLKSHKVGCVGSAIVAGKTTDIVDVGYYLKQIYPNWFIKDTLNSSENGNSNQPRRVLLIDNSAFFRNLIIPPLQASGYEVTAVDTFDRALILHEKRANFDVIVSEVNIDGNKGFEFAKTIKTNSRWKDIPLIALSAHISPEFIARGRAAGFDDYVAKNDSEMLPNTLIETMALKKDIAYDQFSA